MTLVVFKEFGARFRKFLFSYDWGVIEMQGATFKILWGIWALQLFPLFRTINGFSQIATENQWGWFLIAFGSAHIAAVFSRRLYFRRVMTFLSFLFWIFVTVLIYQQSHTAGLIPFFLTIAFFMGLNFLRLSLDAQFIASRRTLGTNGGYVE